MGQQNMFLLDINKTLGGCTVYILCFGLVFIFTVFCRIMSNYIFKAIKIYTRRKKGRPHKNTNV